MQFDLIDCVLRGDPLRPSRVFLIDHHDGTQFNVNVRNFTRHKWLKFLRNKSQLSSISSGDKPVWNLKKKQGMISELSLFLV